MDRGNGVNARSRIGRWDGRELGGARRPIEPAAVEGWKRLQGRRGRTTLAPMRRRSLSRIAMHLLLVVALVIPGIAAPVQAVADGLEAIAAASKADAPVMTMGDMPCDDAGMLPPKSKPCDCCTPQACDFSACLGTAFLPELSRVAAVIPPAGVLLPWQAPAYAPGVIETPLRPPIV